MHSVVNLIVTSQIFLDFPLYMQQVRFRSIGLQRRVREELRHALTRNTEH